MCHIFFFGVSSRLVLHFDELASWVADALFVRRNSPRTITFTEVIREMGDRDGNERKRKKTGNYVQ